MPSYANRDQSFFSGSPTSPSIAGLSLFHDTRRARLADDLSFLCVDMKFPILSKARDAIIETCGSTTRVKPVEAKRQIESLTFSFLRDMLRCRSHSIDSSFFDETDIRQSSLRSAISVDSRKGESVKGDFMQFGEKQSTTCLARGVPQCTSSSSQVSDDTDHSRFSDTPLLPHTFDAGRISQPAIIRRRRAMLPLWINTTLVRVYPNDAESRYFRHSQGLFPSSSETLSVAVTSPMNQSGIQVHVDRLAEGCGQRVDSFEVKQPRDKWNGNWI